MRKFLAVLFAAALVMVASVSVSWGGEPKQEGGTWETFEGFGGTWE